MCADTLQSIVMNYDILMLLWEESLEVVKNTEMRSRIRGVASCMQSFDFFFGVLLSELILRHSDNLSKTLQSPKVSAAEGQSIAKMTLVTLKSIRSESSFELFWDKVLKMTSEKDINDPELPRRRKIPNRLDTSGTENYTFPDVQSYYRQYYFEALDLIINCITTDLTRKVTEFTVNWNLCF